MCMNISEYSLWLACLHHQCFHLPLVLPGAFVLVCLNFIYCSIRAQGWRPEGSGRGTQISQKWGPNTNVLALRKGQDITLTTLEINLCLLPLVGLTHMPTLINPLPNTYKTRRVTPSEEASPASVTSWASRVSQLSFLCIAFLPLFIPPLACVRAEACIIHFATFSSRSQLSFLTCFPFLSAFPLANNFLFSSFSDLPRSNLNPWESNGNGTFACKTKTKWLAPLALQFHTICDAESYIHMVRKCIYLKTRRKDD